MVGVLDNIMTQKHVGFAYITGGHRTWSTTPSYVNEFRNSNDSLGKAIKLFKIKTDGQEYYVTCGIYYCKYVSYSSASTGTIHPVCRYWPVWLTTSVWVVRSGPWNGDIWGFVLGYQLVKLCGFARLSMCHVQILDVQTKKCTCVHSWKEANKDHSNFI